MLCENCEKNEANVKYTQIINGVKKEMTLCEECANKMGIGNFKMNMPISFSNFLGDFFEDSLSLPSFIKEKKQKCNNCGETYDEFVKTGLLGCPECYETFSDRIEPILKNLQGQIEHKGRKPLNIAQKLNNIGENKPAKNNPKNKSENMELTKLEQDLSNAIQEERYEDAAIIRDKIKKLRS